MSHSTSIAKQPPGDRDEALPLRMRTAEARAKLVALLASVGLALAEDELADEVEIRGESGLLATEIYLEIHGQDLLTIELEATADADHRDEPRTVQQYSQLLAGLAALARELDGALWDDDTEEQILPANAQEAATAL